MNSGRFQPGNTRAMTHGGRRRRAVVAQEALGSDVFHRWASDLGGLDRLSEAQKQVLEGTVMAVFIRASAERYLATSKASLTNDRARKALETFLKSHDAVLRGAQALGLQRRETQVPDLRDYLASKGQA